jgi:hypothetical protein
MNTLIIYDQEGYIISQMSGSVREPMGVPFMWVEVPEGKIVAKIDVLGETHIPVFEDLPKSEVDILKTQVSDLTYQLMVKGVL